MKPFTTSLPNLDQLSLTESPDFIEELARDALIQLSGQAVENQALILLLHLAKSYTAQEKIDCAEQVLRDMRERLNKSSLQVQLRYLTEVTRLFLEKGNTSEAQAVWNKAKKLCSHVQDSYAETELAKLILCLSPTEKHSREAAQQALELAA